MHIDSQKTVDKNVNLLYNDNGDRNVNYHRKGRNLMNLSYLNSKIDEIQIPITVIAEKMGISRQSLYLKMDGQREFKASEIEKICDILRLNETERSLIFFADVVDKNDN